MSIIGSSVIGVALQPIKLPANVKVTPASASETAAYNAKTAAAHALDGKQPGLTATGASATMYLPNISQIKPEDREGMLRYAQMLSRNSINDGRVLRMRDGDPSITNLQQYISALQGALDKGFSGVA
jgi:hypothetical protein